MSRLNSPLLLVGVCLLVTVGMQGQTQKPGLVRSVDPALMMARPAAPESPATGSTVAAGPQAVVPRLMKFSGVLSDAAGKPLNGTVDITFALYNTERGGSPLWFETQSVQADDLGRYTALLGAMHSDGLPIDLFTSGEVRWLGIRVGSEAEQQPRVLLVSVPYALKAGDAETLGGKPASAYMLSDAQKGTASSASTTGATQTSTSSNTRKSQTSSKSPATACSSVTSDGTATANSIALFTTACNLESSVITQSSGMATIGAALPASIFAALLNVSGATTSDANARYNVLSFDTTSAATGVGGGIGFSGYYNGTSQAAGFANIRGVKENGTQGNFSSALIFDTRAYPGNQTERMRINSAGNVGIGTSAPQALLHIFGPTSTDSDARYNFILGDSTTAGAGVGGGISFAGYYNGTTNRAGFANIRGVKENSTQGDYATALIFDTRANGGNQTERMRINSAGNLGIGTSAPQARLHIFGPSTPDSDARYNIISTDSTPATAGVGGGISFAGYYVGTTNLLGFANIRGVKENSTQGDNGSALIFDTRANGGNQSERMRISSAGNVGIGTTAPAAKLDVNGTANFNGMATAVAFSGDGTNVSNVNAVKLGGLSKTGYQLAGSYAVTTSANTFTVDQTLNAALSLAQTTGTDVGVIKLGGLPFIHACCSGSAQNTFVGQNAGNFATTGNSNTGSGANALSSNTMGNNNTANGFDTLQSNNTGSSNTASGYEALFSNTTGSSNTASGEDSLQNNDTGNSDAAFGFCALLNTNGTGALTSGCGIPTLSAGGGDTALGTYAGHSNTTGETNTFVGYQADASSGTLTNATAIGAFAVVGESNALVLGSISGQNGATSSVNVGIGNSTPAQALDVAGNINLSGNVTATTGSVTAASFSGDGSSLINLNPLNIGSGTANININGSAGSAGSLNPNCSGCVTAGQLSDFYAASATADGPAANALLLNGLPASAFASSGSNAFTQPQTVTTSSGVPLTAKSNASTGYIFQAQHDGTPIPALTVDVNGFVQASGNLQGANFNASVTNTFIGVSTGNPSTTGNNNVGIGQNSLMADTSGATNSATGASALKANTSGNNNTANGANALMSNTSGSGNIAIGVNALQNNQVGTQNIAVGVYALGLNCQGATGTCTGSGNTAVGFYAGVTGNSANANSIGTNNTFIGYNSGPGTSTRINNATAIGENALVSASNSMVLGGTGTDAVNVGIGTPTPGHALDVVGDIYATGCVHYNGGSVGTCASDMRLKTDIQPFSPALDKLAKLRPVHFNWKASNPPEYRFGPERNAGLIAQEVQQVFPEMVTTDKNGYRRVNYSELPFLLLESVRELKAENDGLREQIKSQEERSHLQKDEEVEQLRREVEELRALVTKSAAQARSENAQTGQ